ncbi:hypothetical protein, partial [Cerasicoccus frondis]|uniref:hypothetical protein n=1 Tax=Cerasicoccus frondis TaxID=490090 RepID=UPI0028529D79
MHLACPKVNRKAYFVRRWQHFSNDSRPQAKYSMPGSVRTGGARCPYRAWYCLSVNPLDETSPVGT